MVGSLAILSTSLLDLGSCIPTCDFLVLTLAGTRQKAHRYLESWNQCDTAFVVQEQILTAGNGP